MPNLGYIHPQTVHFVIALAFAGVIARIVSLLPLGALGKKLGFAGPMAATLIFVSALASVVAVQSGHDAHGPVERVPGSGEAVQEHEEAGEWARNMLLAVAAFELLAIGLYGKPAVAKGLKIASAVVGIATLGAVYKAADRGGDLVYNYAGGIGLRSGDTTDVRRLLVAGLYHNIQLERKAGRKESAAHLVDDLAREVPGDRSVRWLVLESRITDRGDAAGALLALDSIRPDSNDFRGRIQKGMLTSQALEAVGNRDSAVKVLEALRADFPRLQGRIQASIDRIRSGAPAQPTP